MLVFLQDKMFVFKHIISGTPGKESFIKKKRVADDL
jgi:hypothetical protein